MDTEPGVRDSPRSGTGRIILFECREPAERPVAGMGRRLTIARNVRAPERHPVGEVDCDWRRICGALQANHESALPA